MDWRNYFEEDFYPEDINQPVDKGVNIFAIIFTIVLIISYVFI